jgi:hypothetical protein
VYTRVRAQGCCDADRQDRENHHRSLRAGYAELAQYVAPKRRAVEIEGNVEVQDNRTDDQIKAEIAVMAAQLGIPLPQLGG